MPRNLRSQPGTEGYENNVLIAPSETVTAALQFPISGDYVTEVDMDLEIEITIGAATDKYHSPHHRGLLDEGNPITGAVSSVSDGSGTITLTIDRAFEAKVKSTLAYKIALTWESHEDDIDFQGPDYGNKYSVKIIGTQSV